MPQMAPLNWLTLMIMFSIILVMFNVMNFYSFPYKIKGSKMTTKKTTINWKW
uniref:ATP synthase F0 subunit 8 n=1 Tax=Borboresthes tibialis TaxID=2969963 RepID=UPI0021769B82|nr:ATP synthase F0 subunit 8 [Borboresthes tibialis]UUL71616.1 ATP synthase F0 subunit 8 [Borboresthes tibialis]